MDILSNIISDGKYSHKVAANGTRGLPGRSLLDHVHGLQLPAEHRFQNILGVRLRQSGRDLHPAALLRLRRLHLLHPLRHPQVRLQEVHVRQFPGLRRLRGRRTGHRPVAGHPQGPGVGTRAVRGGAVRGLGLGDLGRAGRLHQPGGGGGAEDGALRAVLESDDVVANRRQPDHHLRAGIHQQRGLLPRADHPRMYPSLTQSPAPSSSSSCPTSTTTRSSSPRTRFRSRRKW
jgi:hypothetical protein